EEAIKRTEYFEKRLDEYENIFFKNPLFTSRAKGVGVLSRQRAIELGTTGPTLRGSGVDVDLRKDEPYAAYGELDFKVHTRPDGDSYSRVMVHVDEMRESSQLIRQILKKLPSGPVRRKAPIVVPRGEAYGRVESARGECSFYNNDTRSRKDTEEDTYSISTDAPAAEYAHGYVPRNASQSSNAETDGSQNTSTDVVASATSA